MQKYTLSIFTENTPGVLNRITIMFTRRKINIESLTVSETEKEGISRFTIVVAMEAETIKKLARQINRVIEVREVFVSQNKDLIFYEVALMKVKAESAEKRLEIEELANRYGATVSFVEQNYVVLRKTDREDEISSLALLMEPFGLLEFVRSGRIAILKNGKNPELND